MNFKTGDRVVYAGNETFIGEVASVDGNTVYVEGENARGQSRGRSYDARDLERYEDVVRAYEFEYYVGDRWITITEPTHPEKLPPLEDGDYRNVKPLGYI